MIKKICFFSVYFAIHMQSRMFYAEKYLPKNIELFLVIPKGSNEYKLNRTKIIETEKINNPKFLYFLRKFCRKNKIDLLINLGNPRQGLGMFLVTLGTETKYIFYLISDIWNGPRVRKKLKDKLKFFIEENLSLFPSLIFAKKIVFLAEDLKEKAQKYLFFIKNKIKSSHLIIDEKEFYPKNKILARKKLKLPLNADIIFFVGRIEFLKGSDIIHGLAKKFSEKKFVLIGKIADKIYQKEKLDNIIHRESCSDEELIDYYNAADLCLFPSRIEGYGLVPRESMLCQTPVLVSDIDSLRLLNPALKSKLDLTSFQKQIILFFKMPEKKRQELGKLSRKYIIKENSYNSLKKSMKELLLN